MNNSQNGNNNSPFGMLNNNNQVIPPMSNNNTNVQNPVSNSTNQQVSPQSSSNTTQQSNVVTLGTVSNVTYADTIGNIDYEADNSVKTEEPASNQFINNNINTLDQNSNINNTLDQNNLNNSLSDMNVDGAYNNMNVAPDYVNDPKVMEVLHPDEKKKNTIKINNEMKTFILIALVLLVFIFLMPLLFDLFNKVRFH